MSLLNDDEFTKLTKLCRIQCSEEEKKKFSDNLKKILSLMADLGEVDTENVPPCYQVIPALTEIMRDDVEGPLLSREKFLSNAPSQIGGMIKVPSVMKTSN